jgi:ribosomal protein S21
MLKVEVRKGNLTKAITILSKKVKEDGDLRRATERAEFQTARERLKIKQRRARKWKKVEREDEEFVKNMS